MTRSFFDAVDERYAELGRVPANDTREAHPDHGGSTAAMARLNDARDRGLAQ